MSLMDPLLDWIHPERKRLEEERQRFMQKREKLVHTLAKHGLDGAFLDMEQQLSEIVRRRKDGQ